MFPGDLVPLSEPWTIASFHKCPRICDLGKDWRSALNAQVKKNNNAYKSSVFNCGVASSWRDQRIEAAKATFVEMINMIILTTS